MKHIVIARHGNYDYRDRLDELGKRDIRNLGAKLIDILQDDKILISSSAPRATDSCDVLVSEFGFPKYESFPELWDADDSPCKLLRSEMVEKARSIIEERKERADNILIMTHMYLVDRIAENFCKLNEIEYYGELFDYGEGIHIDIENKKYRLLKMKS